MTEENGIQVPAEIETQLLAVGRGQSVPPQRPLPYRIGVAIGRVLAFPRYIRAFWKGLVDGWRR